MGKQVEKIFVFFQMNSVKITLQVWDIEINSGVCVLSQTNLDTKAHINGHNI
jgi:hypothetical protein